MIANIVVSFCCGMAGGAMALMWVMSEGNSVIVLLNIVAIVIAVAIWTVVLWLSWGNVRALDRLMEDD